MLDLEQAGTFRMLAGRCALAAVVFGMDTFPLCSEFVYGVSWIGERIEHSLSDLAVLSLSAAPSFYLWLLLGACPGAGAEFGI